MKKLVRLVFTAVLIALLSGSCTSSSPASIPSATPVISIPASGTQTSDPIVVITYTPTFADSGSVLILDMTIENKGYDAFNTSPEYFSVMVSNARFSCDTAGSDLKTVAIPDGGKISGRLAFQVPSGTASSKVGYRLVYTGTQVYNVWWVEVKR